MIFFLVVSLIAWILAPILGIFPWLLWLQLRRLSNEKKKSQNQSLVEKISIAIIILTVSVYSSSITVHSDTAVYIESYVKMNWSDIFTQWKSGSDIYGYGLEMVLFILAYPIKLLSNSSPYWFLFAFSLFINSLTVYIARVVSPKHYFHLLLIVFSTATYYTHVFLMRQFLANVFLLLSILNIEFRVFYIFIPLSLFSHLSSLPYLLFATLVKIKAFTPKIFPVKRSTTVDSNLMASKSSSKKNPSFIRKSFVAKVMVLLLMILLAILSQNISGLLSAIMPAVGGEQTLVQRSEHYLGEESDPTNLGGIFVVTCSFLFSGLLFRKFGKLETSPKMIVLTIILASQLAMALFIPSTIRMRLVLFLLSYQGLFAFLLTDSKRKILKYLGWIYPCFSVASIIRYFWFMSSYPEVSGIPVFFQGEVLSKNLIDYILFFVNADVIVD
ncbi:MAG: hypothetical protein RLZZ511_1615 [Cyanobacteriota bacterium]|jgi:hypothetical protein